jgi:mannosyltransferase OCH1-like enzyme
MTKIYYLIIIIIALYIILYFFNNTLKNKIVKYENFDNNTIPKIIIQTWKSHNIPFKYKDDIVSMKKYNQDFKYIFFSDDDIEYFLKKNYPEYYKTYLKLPVFIQKIDFFRYVAVYHYGGFYFDLDMKGLYPLDELLNYDCVFPVDQNIPSSRCNKYRYIKYCKKDLNLLLGQYAFGAKPQNKFIKELCDTIHKNIDKYILEYKVVQEHLKQKEQYVYSSTGPDFVTDVYLDYPKKNEVHILNFPNSQYFGKFAKHNFYGTWKNK